MSYIGLPGSSTYAATKACERLFGEALHYELKPKIDVITFTPGYVDTKLIEREKAKQSFLPALVSAEDSVQAMHQELGKSAVTYGATKHKVFGFIVNNFLPKNLILNKRGEAARKQSAKQK